MQLFYESQTCADLHDKSTGLYLYGDLYVADEFYEGEGGGEVVLSPTCRFVRNSQLVTAGYPWVVIPEERREEYMAVLEKTSG